MMGLNLHAIAHPMVTAIHPDETVTLYQSQGQINVAGKITPIYLPPQEVQAQVQTASDAALYHADRVGQNDVTRNMYLFANPYTPPAGVVRPMARGGDIIQRANGTWWQVVSVPEDFSGVEWVMVRCSLQVKAPDFSASSWWEVQP